MVKFLVGVAVGIALVAIGGYLFLTQGGMPVAARHAQPLPLEELLTGRALHVATQQEAKRPAPIPVDERNLLAGAKLYSRHCAQCHGTLGDPQGPALGQGMFPHPPALLQPGKGVADDPVGETYWKVKNGIRMTGMPSFDGALSDEELWQVSLLLLKADALPGPVRAALQ